MNRKKWVAERDFPELAAIADLLTPEKIVEMDGQTFLESSSQDSGISGKTTRGCGSASP